MLLFLFLLVCVGLACCISRIDEMEIGAIGAVTTGGGTGLLAFFSVSSWQSCYCLLISERKFQIFKCTDSN